VPRYRCRDPGMSELQEESAPGPKEDERLSVDLPDSRARTKYSPPGPAALLRTASRPRSKSIASIDGGVADMAKTVNPAES